jgi:hypothetical protein
VPKHAPSIARVSSITTAIVSAEIDVSEKR